MPASGGYLWLKTAGLPLFLTSDPSCFLGVEEIDW